MRRFCFIHLKKSSICQRFLYNSAISRADTSKLLLKKSRCQSFSASSYSTQRSFSGYSFFDLATVRTTVLSALKPDIGSVLKLYDSRIFHLKFLSLYPNINHMNLLNFESQYPDEISCRKKFKGFRDQQGVICPSCGHTKHYWKQDKESYECKRCRRRQSLRANTVMHGSQLPFRYWFIAIHLLTGAGKSFSSLELQRQLGHKYYEPVWGMVHKLRMLMGKRDENHTLSGTLELDEGFFSTVV